jgi:hypothetical protein
MTIIENIYQKCKDNSFRISVVGEVHACLYCDQLSNSGPVFALSKHESKGSKHGRKAVRLKNVHTPLGYTLTSIFFLRLHPSCTKIFKLLLLLHFTCT